MRKCATIYKAGKSHVFSEYILAEKCRELSYKLKLKNDECLSMLLITSIILL